MMMVQFIDSSNAAGFFIVRGFAVKHVLSTSIVVHRSYLAEICGDDVPGAFKKFCNLTVKKDCR